MIRIMLLNDTEVLCTVLPGMAHSSSTTECGPGSICWFSTQGTVSRKSRNFGPFSGVIIPSVS